jgi:hypothetical protein
LSWKEEALISQYSSPFAEKQTREEQQQSFFSTICCYSNPSAKKGRTIKINTSHTKGDLC